MGFGSSILKLLHIGAAMAALRISEVLAGHRGWFAGLLAGVVAGTLIVTLVGAWRERGAPLRYRPVFVGSSVALAIWYALSPGQPLGPFKLAWLIAALLIAHLFARSFAQGPRNRQTPYRSRDHAGSHR